MDEKDEVTQDNALDDNEVTEISRDEQIDIVAKRILKKYRKAFEELAK